MNLDFLKPVLGDELFAQFSEKVSGATGINLVNLSDGSFIPKAKFDDVNGRVKALTTQVSDLNTQLAAAQQSTSDTTALNSQIAQLTADIAARDGKLQQQALSYRIRDALRGMNVRNADVVAPLLRMDSISEKDGKLVGLTEQVEELKKSDGYLFADAPSPRGGFSGGSLDAGGTAVNSSVNAAIRSMSGRG